MKTELTNIKMKLQLQRYLRAPLKETHVIKVTEDLGEAIPRLFVILPEEAGMS